MQQVPSQSIIITLLKKITVLLTTVTQTMTNHANYNRQHDSNSNYYKKAKSVPTTCHKGT
jgi:hypothetical protein